MEYVKLTKNIINDLNDAVKNDNPILFFETLGFDIYQHEGEIELSGIHTKGGVEMIITLVRKNWIISLKDYYDVFYVDDEVELHMEDDRYRKTFTYRESVEDFEDWESYIEELVKIVNANGNYNYHRHLQHRSAEFVLLFPKNDFILEELDELNDDELMDVAYSHPINVEKFRIDEFMRYFNTTDRNDYYIKFIK